MVVKVCSCGGTYHYGVDSPDTIFVNESNFTPFNFKWDSIFSQKVLKEKEKDCHIKMFKRL